MDYYNLISLKLNAELIANNKTSGITYRLFKISALDLLKNWFHCPQYRSLTGFPVFLRGLWKSQLVTTIQLPSQVQYYVLYFLFFLVNKSIFIYLPKFLTFLSCIESLDIHLVCLWNLWVSRERLALSSKDDEWFLSYYLYVYCLVG